MEPRNGEQEAARARGIEVEEEGERHEKDGKTTSREEKVTLGGSRCTNEGADMAQDATSHGVSQHAFVKGVHGVRYQVKDVARSVAFYEEYLGFKLKHQQLPAFANVALGNAEILLSGPGASGSRTMPNGQQQEPGGWNRVVLKVADLPGFVATLKKAGVHFRNEMEVGPAGRQIQMEDPDGNPLELFEPAR